MIKLLRKKVIGRNVHMSLTALVLFCFSSIAISAQPTVLKLAHQWPAPQNGKGETRSLMAVKFAEMVSKLSDGNLKVEVYPGNSLIQPKQEWRALQTGALDMAIIVPSYFAGQVQAFSGMITMGLMQSNAAGYQFMKSKGGDVMRQLFKKHGVRLVIPFWQPLTIGLRNEKITIPDGLDSLVMRGPGRNIEKIFANAGASIATMPSSDLYFALQTGTVDGVVTSFSSMRSYHLYENLKYVAISPTNGGLLYAFEALVVSNETWSKLNDEQRTAIRNAAKKLLPWVEKSSDGEATRNAKYFKSQDVDVYKLTTTEFDAWIDAGRPILNEYANTSKATAQIVKYAKQVNSELDDK